MVKFVLAFLSLFAISTRLLWGVDIVWPTPSTDFQNGASIEAFIQPTASGIPTSGLFGDVRSNGYKFHEGIDIKPVSRGKKGAPKDEIFAAIDGRVVLVNKIAGNSGYGKYVVLVHDMLDVPVYTLYAHLFSIDESIRVGMAVKAGTTLGIMGHTASYSIPVSRAHLHFEIGVLMSQHFESWYAKQNYKQKNFYGNYNGINLTGFDPMYFFETVKSGKLTSMKALIQKIPTAFVLRLYTKQTPDFVRMYPELADAKSTEYGWDIYFTWFGMPIKFSPIKNPRAGAREGDCEIVEYNPNELTRKCRRHVVVNKKGLPVPTAELKSTLQKLFPKR